MAGKRVAKLAGFVLNTVFHCAVIILVCYVCVFSYRFTYQVFSNPVYDKDAVSYHTVVITEGEDSQSVVKELEEKGVIEDWKIAYFRLLVSPYRGKLKPGSYEVTASMQMDSIFEVLSQNTKEEK